ncbi:lysyl oxidase homolog 2-like isoform X2 [Halichondria panicea]|uniref:lysyl oxidase homolog 2-like isoform X2 n=1 Tax=Halichondria panicea TaxID=6063 RepID=UPI00312B7DF9
MGKFFRFSQSCAGGENTLAECKPTNTLENCRTSENNRQGWVKCIPANCTDGSLRLVGRSNIRQGRVEVCQNKRWGTMCYNQALAGHVCSQLGFPSQAAKEMSSTGPQINCNIDTNNRLSCRNITDSGLCARGLAVECPSFSETIATSALGAVIGLLVLLEVGTVIAWVACTVTRKRLSSPPKQRVLLQVNESYTDTAPMEPSYSSLGPNYNTVTTSDEGIDDYDVFDHNRPKPKPANPPSVKVEASKSDDEFYNAEEHMYAAIDK